MARRWAMWWGVLVALSVSLVAGSAFADKIDRLASRLRNSDDFRVRTQAALALGATKKSKAVDPLCDGLNDSAKSVRAASAAALGKLRKSAGLKCLKRRLDDERSGSVKSVIRKSIKRIERGSTKVVVPSDARYFVRIRVKNKTDRSDKTVKGLVHNAMMKSAKRLEGYVVPSRKHKKAAAKALLAKHPKLSGFFLSPRVKFSFKGGALKLKLKVAIYTYPNKALKGMFTIKLSMSGVKADDESAQDELLTTAGEKAMVKFDTAVDSIR